MSEKESFHPAIKSNGKRPQTEEERLKWFEEFMGFVKLDGVDEKKQLEFKKFLRSYYDQTWKTWYPTLCFLAKDYLPLAQVTAGECFSQKTEVEVKTFGGIHYWLELGQELGESLIVDPVGTSSGFSLAVPYFGPVRNAPEDSRRIYQEGKAAE